MAEEEEADVAAEAVVGKTNKKIVPIILVVNTLLMAGVLVFVMKRPAAPAAAGGKEHAAAPAAPEHAEHAAAAEKSESGEHGAGAEGEGSGVNIRLETFVVSVRATEGDRYAHMSVEVETGTEEDKKFFEVRLARIRDAVIGYLSDRTEDELRGSEGLGQVKAALTKKLDEIVPGHRVKGLYITEFLIQ